MKILFLSNNDVAKPLFKWLKEKEGSVTLFHKKINLEFIKKFKPQFIISYNYKYLIKKDVIDFMGYYNIINLHISLLPWNRGAYPNFWSFIDNTPKGITIHLIDEGLDTGDIILSKQILLDKNQETFFSSYMKLHDEIQKLFINNWQNIKEHKIVPQKQKGKGSCHYIKEFKDIENKTGEIDWNINIKKFKKINSIFTVKHF